MEGGVASFPHPCGEAFEQAVAAGADPQEVVPDDYGLVRGGSSDLPACGTLYSGAVGPDLASAACAVPHGQIRTTTVGDIRRRGGTVIWATEISRKNTINRQHANVVETVATSLSELQPNPVPRADRIDGVVK